MTIERYMKSVALHISTGSPAPKGYTAEDKDGGYRSALRELKISQSAHTDDIATAIIYRREVPAQEIQMEMFL